jgi:hypothetical protein
MIVPQMHFGQCRSHLNKTMLHSAAMCIIDARAGNRTEMANEISLFI